jgi:hypothetical protein
MRAVFPSVVEAIVLSESSCTADKGDVYRSCTTAGDNVLLDTPARDPQVQQCGTSSVLGLPYEHEKQGDAVVHMPGILFS